MNKIELSRTRFTVGCLCGKQGRSLASEDLDDFTERLRHEGWDLGAQAGGGPSRWTCPRCMTGVEAKDRQNEPTTTDEPF